MALIDKDIADELVELRASIALGHDYVPATDLEAALQRHHRREQWWRTMVTGRTPTAHRRLQAGTDGVMAENVEGPT